MMNRALLSAGRQFLQRRALHKGVDSTPPLRFTPVPEKFGVFTVTFYCLHTLILS